VRRALPAAVLTVLLAGCGGGPEPPSENVLALLRQHFLHDEIVGWMREGRSRPATREALAAHGFVLDGSGTRGDQEVDGYSPGPGASAAPPPLLGLTTVHDRATDRLVGVTVLPLAPALQAEAKRLAAFSTGPVPAAGSTTSTVHPLGGHELDEPERFVRISVVSDTARQNPYSIMFSAAAQ
jgi:hypothetical protein